MKGKKVLIVGGSSGIGLALARKVSKEKAHVIIASRSAESCASRLKEEGLEQCEYHSLDITSEKNIEELINKVGEIDHLAVTVKAPLKVAPFQEQKEEDVREAFETKLWGQYNLVKKFSAKMNPRGSITLSSGTLGVRPCKGFSTMSIISGSVESLCKALALELAPLRVNTVSPGFTRWKEMDEKIPLGLADDAQIAHSYLFLMNDSYITGASITSDGGASLI